MKGRLIVILKHIIVSLYMPVFFLAYCIILVTKPIRALAYALMFQRATARDELDDFWLTDCDLKF